MHAKILALLTTKHDKDQLEYYAFKAGIKYMDAVLYVSLSSFLEFKVSPPLPVLRKITLVHEAGEKNK